MTINRGNTRFLFPRIKSLKRADIKTECATLLLNSCNNYEYGCIHLMAKATLKIAMEIFH